MLLTLSQPGRPEFGIRPPHEIASPLQASRSHYSPLGRNSEHSSSFFGGNQYAMSTSHRGLPPPSAMALPEPHRGQQQQPPPPIHSQSHSHPQPQSHLGPMPAPPNQWSGGEDAMRHWLSTKAEEERTKQEEERRRQQEEKTRQESYKLEQRLVEQSILRESMKGGVPPHMIPIIFAGIGGSNLVTASVELLHQYAAQLRANQQQFQHPELPVEAKPDTRGVAPPPGPFTGAALPPPSSILPQQAVFSKAPAPVAAPTSAPRSINPTDLSRINTIDAPASQPSRNADQATSSPTIYFHHWVPPGTSQETKSHMGTPSAPASAVPPQGAEEFKDSPRKRKATGEHKAQPPPPQVSPSFSSQSSTRSRDNSTSQHMRTKSNKSNDEFADGRRPPSRRDSAATNTRQSQEGYGQGHEPHGRPQSHLGQR